MKKILKKFAVLVCVAMLAVVVCNNAFIAQAQAKQIYSNDWMYEKLKDYEPYQELIKEYPNAKKVDSNTKYILSEIVSDQNGKIIKATEKNFSDQKSMEKYQKEKELKNNQSDYDILTVNPGGTVYNTTYSQIQIGLSLYQYTSNNFFVACVYDWLTPPPETLLDYTKGAVGLALDSMMAMNGNTYGGRVTAVSITGEVKDYTSYNGGISIQAQGNNAIGYGFSLPYVTTDIYGVISCEAYKSVPNANYCSAFGEYDSVTYSIDVKNFSISFPAGISFNTATLKDRYTINDALNIR